jgi:hypothetical protein
MRQTSGAPRSAVGGASIDLGDCDDRDAEAILGWPEEFLGSLRGRLLAIRAGAGLPADDLAELKDYGLPDAGSGHPTALGDELIELVVREGWLEGSERRTFREMGLGDGARSVLEIGCSSGWILHSLGQAAGGRRMGGDLDARPLALGYRFSRLENQDCHFARCSALSLPVCKPTDHRRVLSARSS